MAQIALINLTKDWQLVEDIITAKLGETFTFNANKTYQFQYSNGDSPAIFVEPDDIDDVVVQEGFTLRLGDVPLKYKAGNNLFYAKALNSQCQVNVSVLGE